MFDPPIRSFIEPIARLGRMARVRFTEASTYAEMTNWIEPPREVRFIWDDYLDQARLPGKSPVIIAAETHYATEDY